MTRAFSIVAFVLLSLAIWTARVVWGGEQAIASSDAALSNGQPDEAIVQARRAASLYAPGAPHVAFAYRRLTALAVAAEENHRRETALFAWRAVRQASLDTRWIVAPHEADRMRADREIARLLALGPHERVGPDARIEARQLMLLANDERPRLLWVASLLLGLFVAAGGFARAATRVSGAGKVDWSLAKGPLVAVALGIACWALGWWRA
ncbi:MAG: hypothetical protein FJ096_05885 [Deltaproteobacteria bacterium]|nr:hypothetical protein [Deltaproteobacteria bacterium]